MCEGNPDEQFLALLNIHKNCIKDATGSSCVKCNSKLIYELIRKLYTSFSLH